MLRGGENHEEQERIEVLISPKKDDHFPLELLLLLLRSDSIKSSFQRQIRTCYLLPTLKSKDNNKIKGLFETQSNRDIFGKNVGYSLEFVEYYLAFINSFPQFFQGSEAFIARADKAIEGAFISRTIDGKYFIGIQSQVLMLNQGFALYKSSKGMYFSKIAEAKQEFYFGECQYFRPNGPGFYFIKTQTHLQMMIGKWKSGFLRQGLFLRTTHTDALETAMYGQFEKGKLVKGFITHQLSLSEENTQYLIQEVRNGAIYEQRPQNNNSDTNATSNQHI